MSVTSPYREGAAKSWLKKTVSPLTKNSTPKTPHPPSASVTAKPAPGLVKPWYSWVEGCQDCGSPHPAENGPMGSRN